MQNNFYIKNYKNQWKMNDSQYGINPNYLYMREEFVKYWSKIKAKENFALIRWGDGERAIAMGTKVQAQEGWRSEGTSSLGESLLKCMSEKKDNFVHAISCPCCDSETYYWYREYIESTNITFANIWVNGNWELFKRNFEELDRSAILIVNKRGKNKKYGKLNIRGMYFVDDDCVEFWNECGEKFVQEIIDNHGNQKDLLYVVSAGPLAAPIIHRLYMNNPNNTYIDFGSSLDYIIHETITRVYMNNEHEYSRRLCWMPKPDKHLDVDVVLTAYRRPHILKQQLDAIKAQTLKPKRIFLYKDGIDSYYYIGLKDEILELFDGVFIADKNYGVWKRFEYANKVCQSHYVCVFDDDTVPGKRWLENCHIHSLQQEGIYGTNGVIVASRNSGMHLKNIISVGWHSCNEEAVRVDYVGHSWFFRRELLNKMLLFDYSTEFKCTGEDMALSFAGQKVGINTYVPPHPVENIGLWGSLPQYGERYGTDDVAISSISRNLSSMENILKKYESEGFRLLYSMDEYDNIIVSIRDYRVDAIKKDMEELKKYKKGIYLYGAGYIAKIVQKFMEKYGIKILGNVISSKKEYIQDKGVISVDDFIKKDTEKIVFLALDEFYHEEIIEKIKKNKYITIFPKCEMTYSYSFLINYMKLQNR